MEPYFVVIMQQPKLNLQERPDQIESSQGMNSICPKINTDDSYIIQMHTTSMDMFVSTHSIRTILDLLTLNWERQNT